MTLGFEGYAYGHDSDAPPVILNAPLHGYVRYDSSTLPSSPAFYPNALLELRLQVPVSNGPDWILTKYSGDLVAHSQDSGFTLEVHAPEGALQNSPAGFPAILLQFIWRPSGPVIGLPVDLAPGQFPDDLSGFEVITSPGGPELWGRITSVYVVPEPSAFLLMATALGGVIWLGRTACRSRTFG